MSTSISGRIAAFALAAGLAAGHAFAQAPYQPLPPAPTPEPQVEAKPAPLPQADSPQQNQALAPSPAQGKNRLDPLFEALKRERDPEKARGIAAQIALGMSDAGSPTVSLLMQWATKALKEKRNAAALDFLDQVTLLDPDFAEGWNRRATLHYTMGDTRKAMADIAEALKHEPRHFGALAGMAGILSETGKDELAMKAWERYLDIYPADREAQEAVTKLSEKLAGSRT